ncbi:RNA polymerase sigma factor [Tundrisphaera lichenicola]|uniref:RNA polymerase sigma factor n=1 Tax=Tundrisphaera lichenicola TaxID=2029860 RepID=UPI003EBFFADF
MKIRGQVAHQLQILFTAGAVGALGDGELLSRFRRRDALAESAFEALVDRHARMVLRVCRDVLGDAHEAQDAAQATFFLLARRAGSIRKPEALPNWLHGTARRVASRALRDSIRRRQHERRKAEASTNDPVDEVQDRAWPEVHEELARLPARYREPIILCDLTGLTHDQAAGQLGCPPRTLQTRLYRGRERLKERLIRRGVAPASVLVGASWATATRAAVPPAWAASTSRMAFGISGKAGWAAAGNVSSAGVRWARLELKGMLMAKLKLIVAAGLMVGLISGGAWSRMTRGEPGQEGGQAVAPPPAPVEPAEKPKDDFEKAYILADGEDLKLLRGPAIEARNQHYRGKWETIGMGFDPVEKEIPLALLFRWRDGTLQQSSATTGTITIRSSFQWILRASESKPDKFLDAILPTLDLREQGIEGDPQLLEAPLIADFLVRDGAPTAKLLPQFETILRRDFALPVRLSIQEEVRGVVVARGRYRYKPVPDLKPLSEGLRSNGDQIEVYGREMGDFSDPKRFRTDMARGGATLADLFSDLGMFLGVRVVNLVDAPPEGRLDWHITDFRLKKEIGPEERDLVLKHLTEQTGLTFTEEARPIRFIRVDRAE